jgi:hypothetical protein
MNKTKNIKKSKRLTHFGNVKFCALSLQFSLGSWQFGVEVEEAGKFSTLKNKQHNGIQQVHSTPLVCCLTQVTNTNQ